MTKQLFDDFKCDIHPFVVKEAGCDSGETFILVAMSDICRKASTGDIQALRWLEEHGLLTFKKRGKAGTWP